MPVNVIIAQHTGEKGRGRMDAPYVLNFAHLSMSVDKLLTDDKISRSNLTKGSYFGSALKSKTNV